MKVTKYLKGERIDKMMVAGENMYIVEAYGITAQVFDMGKHYNIPMITGGKGNFYKFMEELKIVLEDKPIIFVCVINPRLARVLRKFGFYPVRTLKNR